MESIFTGIYNYFERRQPAFFFTFFASLLVLGFFASRVRFEEDISRVLPKDKRIEKLNEVFQNSKFMDKLVVTISMGNGVPSADSLVNYAAAFVDQASLRLSPYIKKIADRVDDSLATQLFSTVSEHLPVYLEKKDYRSIDSLTLTARLKETLGQNLRTLTSPAGLALKGMISKDPVGISFLGFKKLQQLQYDENFDLYENYVITKDQRHLLIFITPAYPPNNTGKNALLLKGLDSIITEMHNKGFRQEAATYFGATAVSVGNALQLRKDSMLTQGVTVLFIILFLGIYFRKKRAPFIILVPIVFGALFSLAAIYFIRGSISVIALGTGSIVLGIAVNYSLHVFNHYRHTGDIRQVIRDLALPMTVGSLTTIGGFLCLEFVKSEMLKDLGLFAAFSLIGASLSSLIFLPHLVTSGKKELPAKHRTETFIDKLAAYRPEYNKYLVLLIFGLTIFFAFWARKVSFQSDLQDMNFMSAKLKQAENELNSINKFALQSVYLVAEGKTLDEALSTNENLAAKIQGLQSSGVVKKYSGVSSLIISEKLQQERISRWKAYWTPVKKAELMAALRSEGTAQGYSATAFDPFQRLINKEFQPASREAMDAVRINFLDDYITEKPGKTTVVTLVKVVPQHKNDLYRAFENDAAITVLDRQYLTNRFVQIINEDFSSIALMTSILVFVVLLLMYGRLELTLVSFIPMFISWVWILGIMGMAGIKFNIINIIISALIFGLGDDYSLFIMDGLLQEYKTSRKNLSSFKSSILLSAVTTIAGLGVLIFAKHPALKSIALISITGILCVVIMAQILIPYFFNILIRHRVEKKRFPWTITSFHKSAFAFSLFLICSVLFTLLGRVFASLHVREKGKWLYHAMLAKACWVLMYIMGNVKKRILNPLNEDFSKPAIIICNHQSSLDIVPLIMLHTKILMLTNDRKWNAPFFGPVIRMADYFPAEQVERHVDIIADRMRHGYSLIIFPEGTRSEAGVVGRFHKGAFFLAEQLKADILPIMIHGTNYTLTKRDSQLKDGQVTLKFLPRISHDNRSFGSGYAERAKNIGRYFRKSFNELREEIEQPAYFREKLLYNFIYKGPVLEWYMRIKTRLENNYTVFHELVPLKGKVIDIGCGYGFMSYMLYFASESRQITGIDYDEEKIATANHCFSKPETMNFFYTDAISYPFDNYDSIILADMLHYLQPGDQELLVEKCIGHLNPGGVLIIRDGDKDEAALHKRTELTEIFSTRLLKFNKTAGKGLSFISGSMIRDKAASNGMECREIRDSRITSNTIFVLKKFPA